MPQNQKSKSKKIKGRGDGDLIPMLLQKNDARDQTIKLEEEKVLKENSRIEASNRRSAVDYLKKQEYNSPEARAHRAIYGTPQSQTNRSQMPTSRSRYVGTPGSQTSRSRPVHRESTYVSTRSTASTGSTTSTGSTLSQIGKKDDKLMKQRRSLFGFGGKKNSKSKSKKST
jgi:hypothetical protein